MKAQDIINEIRDELRASIERTQNRLAELAELCSGHDHDIIGTIDDIKDDLTQMMDPHEDSIEQKLRHAIVEANRFDKEIGIQ